LDYGDFLIVKAISYTKYESALECLPPPEYEEAERGSANATKYKFHAMRYGEILEHKFLVPKATLTYDTRHFKSQLLLSKEDENQNGITDTRAEIVI
jgi:hypothetical protein